VWPAFATLSAPISGWNNPGTYRLRPGYLTENPKMLTGKLSAGENIVCEVVGDTLALTIDLKAQAVPSATGKTLLVASTRGAIPVSYPSLPGLKVSVNVTVPARYPGNS
jgi:hypothetical protein